MAVALFLLKEGSVDSLDAQVQATEAPHLDAKMIHLLGWGEVAPARLSRLKHPVRIRVFSNSSTAAVVPGI